MKRPMVSGRLRLLLAPALGVVAALALAPSAHAAATCTYDDTFGIVDIQIAGSPSNPERLLTLDVDSFTNDLLFLRNGVLIDCTGAGGPPDTSNTGVVTVTDVSDDPGTATPNDGDARFTILDPAGFAPGRGAETAPETPEIEFSVNMGNGTDDRLQLADLGVAQSNVWQFGGLGINWNGAGSDTDVELNPAGAEQLIFQGAFNSDFISGQGGDGTGAPFAEATKTFMFGGDGGDQLNGGNGADSIDGQAGNDFVRGMEGADELGAGSGLNTIEGGPGTDIAGFAPGGTTVDLAITGHQDTGSASDAISGVENVQGSDGEADSLLGDDGPNVLIGEDGADTLVGRGGNDQLFGGARNDVSAGDGGDLLDGGPGDDLLDGNPGVDTATYANSGSGVTANLDLQVATGDGSDTFAGVENLVGSPFADSLIGNDLGNAIVGLGGTDTISAAAGPDAVDVRDGEADTASCGTEIDTAIADQASLDAVDPDCETVSFLPEPDLGGGGGGGGLGDTELSFDLTGKAKQKVVKQKGVIVTASCPLEACTATASGKGTLPKPKRVGLSKLTLKPVTETVAAGVEERIKLRLKKRQLRAVRAVLAAGKRPKVTVTVDASDAAGNSLADELIVTARR